MAIASYQYTNKATPKTAGALAGSISTTPLIPHSHTTTIALANRTTSSSTALALASFGFWTIITGILQLCMGRITRGSGLGALIWGAIEIWDLHSITGRRGRRTTWCFTGQELGRFLLSRDRKSGRN